MLMVSFNKAKMKRENQLCWGPRNSHLRCKALKPRGQERGLWIEAKLVRLGAPGFRRFRGFGVQGVGSMVDADKLSIRG